MHKCRAKETVLGPQKGGVTGHVTQTKTPPSYHSAAVERRLFHFDSDPYGLYLSYPAYIHVYLYTHMCVYIHMRPISIVAKETPPPPQPPTA